MALKLSANNCCDRKIVVAPQNRILIPQLGLGFPCSLVNHRTNPTLNHKFRILCPHRRSHYRTSNLSSKDGTIIAVSATSSSSASDVIQVDEDSSSATTSSTVSSNWLEFARNVSGEWDGYGADFSSDGKPIELPETVVPEAYREWEVKVFDWQTQCPTLVQPEDFTFLYKSIKLLPTVGCEADAATRYSIDERKLGGEENLASVFAYQSSGCYVAVWPMENLATYKLFELEHCLIDPQNRESRVRIIQVVRVENTKFVLKNIKVFCEQWYGPFRNGDLLGGCAIRDSAFASTDALKSSEVTGVWQGLHAAAFFHNTSDSIHRELLDDNVRKSERNEDNLVLLPKQLWCSLKETENGDMCCEVGWLLEQGHAITSKCIISPDTELKEIAVAREMMVVTHY